MARDAGCVYAIVGHSERRRLFGEDGPVLAKKIARCREAGLVPIYCVGETADERDAGLTATTLARQLDALEADREVPAAGRRVRAGVGHRDRPHGLSRGLRLRARPHRRDPLGPAGPAPALRRFGHPRERCRPLLGAPRTDGFLIGGASLSADAFAAIARA